MYVKDLIAPQLLMLHRLQVQDCMQTVILLSVERKSRSFGRGHGTISVLVIEDGRLSAL